jgi:hypothetical protein
MVGQSSNIITQLRVLGNSSYPAVPPEASPCVLRPQRRRAAIGAPCSLLPLFLPAVVLRLGYLPQPDATNQTHLCRLHPGLMFSRLPARRGPGGFRYVGAEVRDSTATLRVAADDRGLPIIYFLRITE